MKHIDYQFEDLDLVRKVLIKKSLKKLFTKDFAEDIAQEVLLHMLERRDQFTPIPNEKHSVLKWATSIYRTVLDTYFNKNSTKEYWNLVYDDKVLNLLDDNNACKAYESIEYLQELDRIKNILPPMKYQFMILHAVGYSNNEIATYFHVTENKVKKDIFRSREKLAA